MRSNSVMASLDSFLILIARSLVGFLDPLAYLQNADFFISHLLAKVTCEIHVFLRYCKIVINILKKELTVVDTII